MKNYNPQIHHRRSIRLAGYDYKQAGLFFITICVQNRKCLFGDIVESFFEDGSGKCDDGVWGSVEGAPTRGARTLVLNDAGIMVEREWLLLPDRFPQIKLHEYIIMPNHFHGIIEIVRVSLVGAPIYENETQIHNNKHIGEIIGAFKSCSTNAYIAGVKTQSWPPFEKRLWQRNFWEHIIRDEKAYENIRNYILKNPENWITDTLQPEFRKVAC
jgi:REP element-mobilizing transposase RayT